MKMTIKKTKKLVDHYEIKCCRCGKIINGVSIKSVRHSEKIHELFCKREVNKNDKVQH